jgi:hypothetical protein
MPVCGDAEHPKFLDSSLDEHVPLRVAGSSGQRVVIAAPVKGRLGQKPLNENQ